METRGLVFIPDISGFTQFVNQVEIDHGRLIIKELLEIIIDANDTGLELSEIEGDAILFYRFGQEPSLDEIYRQVEKMFCSFHRSLKEYEHRRYCQCKACLSAVQLTLKVITHYGEFTTYDVRNFKKLIGRDVIVAHRLLKNDIDSHEYWLVTDGLFTSNSNETLPDWISWDTSSKETEAGESEILFRRTKSASQAGFNSTTYQPVLLAKDKMISLSADYEADIITLFHASGDPSHRHHWFPGVKGIQVTNHFLPRVGMSWKVLQDDGDAMYNASGYNYQDNRIEFTETEIDKGYITHFLLEKKADTLTKLTIELYVNKPLVQKLLFKFSEKKKYNERFEKGMKALQIFSKQVWAEETKAQQSTIA